jgi:hypothetical protein
MQTMPSFPFISRRRSQPESQRPSGARSRHRPDTMPRIRWY